MLPKISKDSLTATINTLEDRFPDRLPHKVVTMEQMYMLLGQQSVIRYLKEILEVSYE